MAFAIGNPYNPLSVSGLDDGKYAEKVKNLRWWLQESLCKFCPKTVGKRIFNSYHHHLYRRSRNARKLNEKALYQKAKKSNIYTINPLECIKNTNKFCWNNKSLPKDNKHGFDTLELFV